MSAGCIFCKIIEGSEQARIIYQDSRSIAFLPRTLFSKGHTLVVPKQHYSDIFDMPTDVAAALMDVSIRLSEHYRNVLGCSGVNLLNASGRAAQQSVFHFHFHLMPRFSDDGLDTWPDLKPWHGDIDKLTSVMSVNFTR